MQHTSIARSLMVIGGALLTAPAIASPDDDAATTWTATFRIVNSTPEPTKKWVEISLSVGCPSVAAQNQTKVERNGTLDVSCVVGNESASLAYTVAWTYTNPRERTTSVETHSGSVSHSCEQDEIAKVTVTDVGSMHTTPTVTRSTECVDADD